MNLRILVRGVAAVVAAFLFAGQANAQAVTQSGPILNGGGHAPMYLPSGPQGLAAVMDSGPAGGGPIGYGLSEKLLQARSPGTGPDGTHDCDWSTYATNPAGASYLCFDPNALGGGLLDYNSPTGAPFQIKSNGAVYKLPFVLTPPGTIGLNVNQFGADPTGATDSTAAFNSCLATVGTLCWAANGRYLLNGPVHISGGSTLDCGYAMGDLGSSTSAPGNLNVYPALLLTPGSGEITASGPSARVKGCLILNRNLTFPVANGSGFAGIALADNGNASFSVVDSEILGFDTGIWITGNRPYLQHLILDDTGINHASLEIDTGNTDSGVADDVKLQTGQSGTGCGNIRPGTGIRIGGSIPGATGVFLNNIVVQGFQTANYDFANSIKGGIIWSDDEGINCGYTGTGIIVEPNVTAEFDNVTVAQPNVGLQLLGNGAPFQVNQLYVEDTGSDGIQMGSSGQPGSNAIIGQLIEATIGGYGVNILNSSYGFATQYAAMAGVIHGGVAPYFNNATGSNIQMGRKSGLNSFFINDLQTNLGSGHTSPYSSNMLVGTGGEPVVSGLTPSITLCGAGGLTSCVFSSGNSDQNAGSVTITASSTPTASSEINLTMPVTPVSGQACVATVAPGSTGLWAPGATVQSVGPAGAAIEFDVSNNGVNLTPGADYRFIYNCRWF